MENNINKLFNIQYPIIQGGMVWCCGWKLASAVSNAGGLGLIGSGSMDPEILQLHIQKCKVATTKPFGVNVPLLYPHAQQHIKTIIKEGVKIVFTSAGNPATYTQLLKQNGITVVHVIANTKFALKAQEAGVDAIVAEGFEAGGHNGREETSSFCLIPQIKKIAKVPLIAAGGMYSGQSLLAAQVLGADGIQIGSRFAVCNESSAHTNYKNLVRAATEGSTILTLKQLTPVRMLKNAFYEQIKQAEENHYSVDQMKALLGRGRSKKGILEGDLTAGELEIGQVASLIEKQESAAEIINEIMNEYLRSKQSLLEN